MNRSALGQNLRPLVRAGLITMTPSKDDARSKQISLSARGYRRFAVARNLWKLAQREYARIGGRAAADHGRDVMNALAMNQQF